MDNYTVYVHIDPEGKRYYGATKMDVERRWKDGRGYKNNLYFWKSIQKYGWGNIQHIIVARGLSKEEAHWLEEELIKTFDTTNRYKGYNITKGIGRKGLKHSEETKNKISEANKGENNGMYGKQRTEEHTKKICKAKSKPVIGIPLDSTNKTILTIARKDVSNYGFDPGHVGKCIRKVYKAHKGYKWYWINYKHNKKYRIKGE